MLKTRVFTGRISRGLIAALTVASLVAVGALAAGCSTPAAEKTAPPASTKPAAKPSAPASATAAADVQTCLECGTKKMPPKTVGAAVVQNGVQIVTIDIKGGTYVPNTISVKAGMPVQVVFSGKAKGCLAKPMFKALGKKLDLTSMMTGTIDLGTVKKGTYKFTCGMGMNAGTITAS